MTSRVYEDLLRRWQGSIQDLDTLIFGVRVTIKTAWTKALKAAGIVDFHLHDCRHSAITRMIRAGLPPVEVMRVSGHTTMAAFYRYCNTDSDTVFRVAAALDSLNREAFAAAPAEQEVTNCSEMVN